MEATGPGRGYIYVLRLALVVDVFDPSPIHHWFYLLFTSSPIHRREVSWSFFDFNLLLVYPPTSSTSTGSIDHILSATSLAHTLIVPECLSGSIIHPHTAPYHYTNTWQMEDHLCPRLVQPSAACLTCLARPQPLAKPQAPRCYYTRTTTTSSTARASKRSPPSQAPTQPTPRPTSAAQPATLPLPLPRPTSPPHRNTLQHMPRTHDLDKFAVVNITTTELPPLQDQPQASPLLPSETSRLYERLMKRYSGGVAPLLRPINSWRDLPTTRTTSRTRSRN